MQVEAFARITELVEKARTVAICAHTSPDGDALGSVLGLALTLKAKWPELEVVPLLADERPVPRIYRFLPSCHELVFAGKYTQTPDLFIAVDLSSINRLADGKAVCERARSVAVIDHHLCDKPFGDASIIRTSAAAAGIIVLEYAMYLGIGITPAIAQNLMCAIVTDTGRFQFQNSDGEAFSAASLLVSAGASPSEISLNVYQSFRLQYLHLKSLVMGRITTFEHGRIAYSYATENDWKLTGADLDESDGLIDVVRSVEGSQIALFLKSVPGGKVRGNLRSKDYHDVSEVARLMGGGGHKAAAGFTYEGDIDEALAAVLPRLRAMLREEDARYSNKRTCSVCGGEGCDEA
ncbi:MAG: bifunctional oligoribonuclease/PAP phosphatase NrnA [Coriobacteriales bacterium]|nr:bifunctional oligoribonuclease/PAP phosphatase NrnA [Coriobacteriales bacterium]